MIKNNYKLIAIDVDGTLMNEDSLISTQSRTAITKALTTGINIVLCSGRSYASLIHIATDLGIYGKDSFVIAFNGCAIYSLYENKVLHQQLLSTHLAVDALTIQENSNIDALPVVYKNAESVIMKQMSEYMQKYWETSKVAPTFNPNIIQATKALPHTNKIIFIADNQELIKLQNLLQQNISNATTIFTADFMLEVIPKNASKAAGLKWLCNNLNIDIANTIAIGDNFNDISMIQAAGLGVAVQNAVTPAKQAASYITKKTCTQGAVAEVIERFAL